MKIRFLQTNYNPAALNMGIDEAVLQHVAEGKVPPTLRLYGWKPPAVSIGYFQGLTQEVDLDKCKEQGIDVVRRITGGGAVFHDAEVTYSFIIPVQNELTPFEIMGSYQKICGGIIEGLKLLGLEAQFVPLNDIVVKGKKVSGNAQTRRQGCILQHGTVLIDVDVKKMFSLLKVPNEKIRDKMIQAVEERVTSINHQLQKKMAFEDVVRVLRSGFEKALSIETDPQELTSSELASAQKCAQEKYSTEAWNFKR